MLSLHLITTQGRLAELLLLLVSTGNALSILLLSPGSEGSPVSSTN